MRKPLYIFLLVHILLWGCGTHSSNNKELTASDVKTSATNLFRRDSIVMDSIRKLKPVSTAIEKDLMDTPILTKNIRYNLFSFRNVTLQEPFSADSALVKLFPGSYYKLWRNDSDSIVFEAWRCKSCTRKIFQGWATDSLGERFPYPDSNETQPRDTLLFKVNRKRSIIMSFCTTYLEEDFIGMGRMSSAFLGLALFTEENNKWVLKAFNPAIGLYGMFQEVPGIHRIKYGKENIGCYIGETLGGSGGPYFTSAYFFAVDGNSFKIVLKRDNVVCGDTPRNTRDSHHEIDSSQMNRQFADIIITTEGDYRKVENDSTYGDDTSAAPSAIIPLILAHKDDFDYVIKARYTFTGSKYKLLKEKVTCSPHDDSKDPKDFKYSW